MNITYSILYSLLTTEYRYCPLYVSVLLPEYHYKALYTYGHDTLRSDRFCYYKRTALFFYAARPLPIPARSGSPLPLCFFFSILPLPLSPPPLLLLLHPSLLPFPVLSSPTSLCVSSTCARVCSSPVAPFFIYFLVVSSLLLTALLDAVTNLQLLLTPTTTTHFPSQPL